MNQATDLIEHLSYEICLSLLCIENLVYKVETEKLEYCSNLADGRFSIPAFHRIIATHKNL